MKKALKIAAVVLSLVVFALYIAGASRIINIFVKPTEPFSEQFGSYTIVSAQGDIDPDDPNENSIFDNADKNLLYGENTQLSGKQLMNLYKAELSENEQPKEAQIKIEISEDVAEDKSIMAVQVDDENNCHVIEHSIISEEEDGAQKYYMVFSIDEPGYYGMLSDRGQAHLSGMIAAVTLGVIIVFYVLVFVLPDIRKKRKK